MKKMFLLIALLLMMSTALVVEVLKTKPENAPTAAPKVATEEIEVTAPINISARPDVSFPGKWIEVNLSSGHVLLWDDGMLKNYIKIAYQAKEGKWYQTPTGYFKVGIKDKDHVSSLTGVRMPYSVQIYEDFFLHEIPIDKDGNQLTSDYTGGCLRFETEDAKKIYEFAETGMQIVIYNKFQVLPLWGESPQFPISLNQFWIRQRFNNPIRHFWDYRGDLANIGKDYYQHTGVDLAPGSDESDLNAYAIEDGIVVEVFKNGYGDHGLGNTIILGHETGQRVFYSLYAHLASFAGFPVGERVSKGAVIGTIGNTGNGCDYWRIGEDGCNNNNPPDTHLHFEIKTMPILGNPNGGKACKNKDGSERICYGYTPNNPKNYGYIDPIEFLMNPF